MSVRGRTLPPNSPSQKQAIKRHVRYRPVTATSGHLELTCVSYIIKVTYMEKTQVYLRKEELEALRKVAARSRRSVAALVREAVRKVVLMPAAEGPIAIWDGEPKRNSLDHDSVHDEP
jgi:hypothetical protein